MKRLLPRTYTTTNSALNVKIVKVYYQCDEYTKVKLHLCDKNGNSFSKLNGDNHKLYFKNIQHWKQIWKNTY